jgi:hypothetical protein|tara:strand:- start:989 stop:1306 length:318 start_codon:yes stop_codon:yes gene_type:complete
MAVTKTLTKSIPHVKSSKAEKWDLEMTYENDSEGDATYYKSVFSHTAIAADGDFTKAAKGSFNLAALTAMCPVSTWDDVFDSQVDSVITNPVVPPVPDEAFTVPS